MKQLTHGALFNGIAGFPLAASWAGIPTTWTVEIDEFCNKVSKKHFPDAVQYTDIKTASNLPYVDIISGGFPCQPFSVAGKQLGNEDDRALWPEMLRIIREVKPSYVLGENVTGIINLALDEVLTSLEAEGYTVETFVVPACSVGAPHRRDRVWIVAYSNGSGSRRWSTDSNRKNENKTFGTDLHIEADRFSEVGPVTYATVEGLQITRQARKRELRKEERERLDNRSEFICRSAISGFRLTESPVCRPNDGVSSELGGIRRIELNHKKYASNKHKVGSQEGQPTIDFIIWKVLRTMWQYKSLAKASPSLYLSKLYNSVPELPRESGSSGWFQKNETTEELRCLWESFYAKSFQEAQDMQSGLLECIREIERRKTLGQTVRNRAKQLKAYGNAIVPAVAYEFFQCILTHYNEA